MADTFTIYYFHDSVPPLCSAAASPPKPGDPASLGQIGCFPICGERTAYLVTMKPIGEGDPTAYTGACERHIFDLRGQMQRWITEIEEYNLPNFTFVPGAVKILDGYDLVERPLNLGSLE